MIIYTLKYDVLSSSIRFQVNKLTIDELHLFRAIPFNIHTPSPLWIRVGRFIDKTEKTIFKKKPDSIDFSFDKKPKKTGKKLGKILETSVQK